MVASMIAERYVQTYNNLDYNISQMNAAATSSNYKNSHRCQDAETKQENRGQLMNSTVLKLALTIL